jgi:ABC-type glycerol-3-phosphate transport system substrate-binding protein
MSSTCENKDGAWQFIRKLLTKEYQETNTWGDFPTNQEAFDKA